MLFDIATGISVRTADFFKFLKRGISNNYYLFFFPTKFFLSTKFLFFKNVPGVLKRMHTFFWGALGRSGSENDTLLPMTMTCDRLKFWSGPAWRSKVIIQKPWRRKNKKNK